MYSTYLAPDNKNVPALREHINGIVCTRESGTFPIIADPLHLYVKGDVTIRRVNNTYYFRDRAFEIKDGSLIIDGKRITLPTRTTISTVERLMLSLGMGILTEDVNAVFDITEHSARSILSSMTTLAMRDLGIITNNMRFAKLIKYGEVVFDTYLMIARGSGRIKATNPSIRWLNEVDTLQLKSKLFSTSDHRSYQAGVHSMQYEPTPLAEMVFQTALTLLLAIDFKENEIIPQPLDFVVPIGLLREIRLRDTMLLLADYVGYNNGFVIRPTLKDDQHSRVYSVFTSIGSETRKRLGFINYDIGSALQAICMHLVVDPSKYPLHQQLVNDRRRFRTQIADEANEDIAWVKEELTSADNREDMPKRYNTIPTLKAYFEEALVLRKEVIGSAESTILDRAMEYAKPEWIKVWDEAEKKYDFIDSGRKKESSIFFFIWTQWERQIREVMMSCFDNPYACHQVHDAIYSRQIIDPKVIEAAVLEQTGFKVQISAE
ncbi:hypothetical protein [Sulfuricurvum sp.]|uniref:hypothetical protein n=1 Tax=Sulfuricurvum sp. TaxID=2025608 RepID=UPI0026306CD5|nr:hypothetical protein [Sulfuricurvum sp.]MDD3597091.1 hypothetical protein [Sulfuricurvum sp.]